MAFMSAICIFILGKTQSIPFLYRNYKLNKSSEKLIQGQIFQFSLLMGLTAMVPSARYFLKDDLVIYK
jgi:hypothetical protein